MLKDRILERLREAGAGEFVSGQELFKMLPYVVTILFLIVISMRRKRDAQPPAHLGLPYFREER